MRRRSSFTALAQAGAMLAVMVLTASAQASLIWDGGGADDKWSTAANWDDDVAPGSTSTGILHFAGSTRTAPNNDYGTGPWGGIQFDSGASSFSFSGNAIKLFGANGGIVNLSGANQTFTKTLLIGDTCNLAAGAGLKFTGQFQLWTSSNTTTTVTTTGVITAVTGVFGGSTTTPATLATLAVGSGANLSFSNVIQVGYNSTFQNGGINQTGGSITSATVYVGNTADATNTQGVYNISSGVLSTSMLVLGCKTSAAAATGGATGTVNQSGGVVKVATNTYSLVLGSASAASGTYNLSGGKLYAARMDNLAGTGNFNWSGGTISAYDDVACLTIATTAPINLTGNGAVFDTTDSYGNATPIFVESVIGGNHGITKIGEETLEFIAANTYTGSTNVKDGTLKLDNPCLSDTGSVLIDGADGAKLDLNFTGTDTIGALWLNGVTVADGTWGAIGSTAEHTTEYITGTGLLDVVAVPEPSAMVMLIGGLVGLVAYAWRKRK